VEVEVEVAWWRDDEGARRPVVAGELLEAEMLTRGAGLLEGADRSGKGDFFEMSSDVSDDVLVFQVAGFPTEEGFESRRSDFVVDNRAEGGLAAAGGGGSGGVMIAASGGLMVNVIIKLQ
jgi:hypothetical protein